MEDLWLLLKYLFLGLLQGFTEPIPISSSGHLVLVQNLFNVGIADNLSFEILVNFGSLIAVLTVYRKDIILIAKNTIGYVTKKDPALRDDFMFVVYLVIATVPAGVIGVFF